MPNAYTHVYTHVYAHAYAHVYTHVYAHVYTHVYTHVYAHAYTHVRSPPTLAVQAMRSMGLSVTSSVPCAAAIPPRSAHAPRFTTSCLRHPS